MNDMSTLKELSFPDLIRRQREEKGLTKKELGHKTGVSEPFISRLESGKIGTPKKRKEFFLEMVAVELEIPMPILLEAAFKWDLRFRGELLEKLCAIDDKLTAELFKLVQEAANYQVKEMLCQSCSLLRQYLPHI
jgi:transcriptional regulator with XRE-family HTH domain